METILSCLLSVVLIVTLVFITIEHYYRICLLKAVKKSTEPATELCEDEIITENNETKAEKEYVDYSTFSYEELKELGKKEKIKFYYKLHKSDLIKQLDAKQRGL